MTKLIIDISKYVLLVLIALYTLQSYIVFKQKNEDAREFLFLRQNVLMFAIHFVAFTVFYLKVEEPTLFYFYGAQAIYLGAVLVLFRNLYPRASKLLINNMCMLITVGFIMLTRLSYDLSLKQFQILVIATVVALIVPILIKKMKFLSKGGYFYAILGVGLLAAVAVMGSTTYGAKLSLNFGGIALQPSEFVKIIFVFCVASLLAHSTKFINIVVTTVIAALHVLILVASTDLGSALIFFVTYLVMLYVGSRDWRYLVLGISAGVVAAVAAYSLFSHVRVRVEIWKNPFAAYTGDGYQIAQSLFAIGAGGWFGTGLYQGSPGAIPIAHQDFMFSAICEELGSLFGICLILICMSCFIMFVNIALKMERQFCRLAALGLGCIYSVQVFLTVGGAMKMIPMTGVTLPFISYGGSSIMSTILTFSIVQGFYISRKEEVQENPYPEGAYYYNPYPNPYGQNYNGWSYEGQPMNGQDYQTPPYPDGNYQDYGYPNNGYQEIPPQNGPYPPPPYGNYPPYQESAPEDAYGDYTQGWGNGYAPSQEFPGDDGMMDETYEPMYDEEDRKDAHEKKGRFKKFSKAARKQKKSK